MVDEAPILIMIDQIISRIQIKDQPTGVAILSFASLVYICENELRDRVKISVIMR